MPKEDEIKVYEFLISYAIIIKDGEEYD